VVPVLLRTRRLSRRPIAPKEVRTRAERMLKALALEGSELSILLCNDATIRTLNRQYRQIDRPTDVLAFPQDEVGKKSAPDQDSLLGDVVISLETARRQARKASRSVASEVTMLLAHGLLHLLGFDHRTPSEERRMKARTDALCAAARPPRGI
jgi:probable rRNA maturation factor